MKFVYFANLFLYRNSAAPDSLLFAARFVTILLTVLFGAYFAWWVRRRAGPLAGLFGLALFAFDPNLIAHGRYVTTDLATALFIFMTLTLWLEYLREGGWHWLVLSGLALGLALASKYSAVYLLPVLLILYWCQAHNLRQFITATAILGAISFIVLAVVYWPEVRHSGSLPPLGLALARKGPAGPLLSFAADRLHLPEYTYLVGLDRLSEHEAIGHPSYLLGNLSDHGFWYYFPVAFAVKTPAALLVGLLLAGIVARQAPDRFLAGALAFSAAAYFAMAMCASIDIGIRHLLPVYPLLYAAAAMILTNSSIRKSALIIPLLVALESATIFPNYLTFFNVFAGGPSAGPKYLLDSNLDWGQSAGELGRYMRLQHIPRVKLSFFGNVDLPHYGVYSDPLLPRTDPATLDTVAAISATPLYGLYVGPDAYAAFRSLRPTAVIGNSIYLYDLRRGHR